MGAPTPEAKSYPRAASPPGYPEHPIHGARHRDPATTLSTRAAIDFRGVESDGTSEIVYNEKQNSAEWNIVKELVMGNFGTKKLEGIVLLEPGKTKALPMLASTRGKEKYGTFSENKNIPRANEKVILGDLLNPILCARVSAVEVEASTLMCQIPVLRVYHSNHA